MSQKNVEIVRAVYDAVNRDDWDAAFRHAHADFELTLADRSLHAGTHRGRQKVEAIMRDQQAAFDASVVEVERLVATVDQVVAIVTTRLRPKGSSAELQLRNGHVWTIRAGEVVSMRGFPEPEKALEAVGLPAQDAHADS
jgi:ketosteroid isomerase-like protein